MFRIYGPLGTFFLRDNDKPLIFVCTGTGFAPIKSMVEYLINSGSTKALHIYWGARRATDLYSDLPTLWANSYDHIKFVPVLSREKVIDEPGFEGYVQDAVVFDQPDLGGFDIYACGSEKMISHAKKVFFEHGLCDSSFYSDAFVSSE